MKVLLFEAQDDSSRSQDALADEPEIAVDILNAAADITVTFATSVIEESDRTSIDPSDVILIDISQSNTNGLDFLAEIKRAIPRIPIVVLADQEHQRKALQAIRTGAQDFLLMGRASGASIVRALRFAIERHRFEDTQNATLFDELTGLYNWKGFSLIGEHQLKLASRKRQKLLFFFAFLNYLDDILEEHGDQSAKDAINSAAEILRNSFRDSDILGRLGRDVFTVIAVDAIDDSGGNIINRLQENLRAYKNTTTAPYELFLTAGQEVFDTLETATVSELISRVELTVAEHRRTRRGE